jgi:hypothetical protein
MLLILRINNLIEFYKSSNEQEERYNKMKLSIEWNHIHIGIEEMRKEVNEEHKLSNNEIQNLFENALLENKHQFVNLLLENGIEIKTFLKVYRFKNLILDENEEQKKREPLYFYLKKASKYSKIDDNFNFQYKNIEKLRKEIFPTINFNLLPTIEESESMNEFVEEPEMYLFFWCILTNRIEIAKIFWKLGKVC